MSKVRPRAVQVLLLAAAASLVWGVTELGTMDRYIEAVQSGNRASGIAAANLKQDNLPVWNAYIDRENPELLQQLREEADKLRIEPINARLDRVWKAIPGLNGRELDIEKTYRLAQQQPVGTPVTYIYKELTPKIQLEDLGAHPIYRGNPHKKMVSMMINVAWGDEYLPGMLATLEKENVKATFFLDGSWLSKNMEMAQTIQKAGHELSNHAYSHKMMSKLSRNKAQEEILKTEKLLKQLGVENKLFAPPSGDYNQETVELANSLNLKTILWTIDTVDWKKPAPEAILRKIGANLEPGALILMHPTASSEQALGGMIHEAKKRGYALGTVSELISQERLPELETEPVK